MTKFVVDVEADGPVPGLYSMVSIGVVVFDEKLDRTFYDEFRPISSRWVPEGLAISGFTREETLQFPDPIEGCTRLEEFVKQNMAGKRAYFFSDNNGFDWQFVNYYLWAFLGRNIFGHSSTNINSLFKGLQKNMFVNIHKLRTTKHDHNPVNDAMGNAEALLEMRRMGFKIPF